MFSFKQKFSPTCALPVDPAEKIHTAIKLILKNSKDKALIGAALKFSSNLTLNLGSLEFAVYRIHAFGKMIITDDLNFRHVSDIRENFHHSRDDLFELMSKANLANVGFTDEIFVSLKRDVELCLQEQNAKTFLYFITALKSQKLEDPKFAAELIKVLKKQDCLKEVTENLASHQATFEAWASTHANERGLVMRMHAHISSFGELPHPSTYLKSPVSMNWSKEDISSKKNGSKEGKMHSKL
ncbi:MAG: hypothetical protein ACHQAX_06970 [Gammaproteobacteria bacterium]